jgi:uncharacterized protein YyaL (SSP411 family)
MTNRLAGETSPYLLQHAHNPVDWFPWGDEALSEARRRDVPILLSIGYAACHWCHVMERESFEDPSIAKLMNSRFVPIKVDREERPDLDAIYMDAVQAMTGRGGWPMTVFLTPDGAPFYGGTYYPPEDRHGMPGFTRVLDAIHEAWTTRRDELAQQGSALLQHISRTTTFQPAEDEPTEEILQRAAAVLASSFDAEWGGFGGAPKFPQPMTIEFLLRMNARGAPGTLEMAERTLDKMARGGMFDQVGGGFARYSVDPVWLVPHFEKMLYDNGQLLRLYTRAWLVTHDNLYRDIALATAGYLLRETRHPGGGFFSSQDADSEGIEGKFYVWNYDEFMGVAGDDARAAGAFYGVTPGGNWEGTNVLWRPRDDDVVALELGVKVPELRDAVARARARLFEARESRIRPGTDDKILASWNGLAISGLAEAGRVFGRQDLVDAAVAAGRFILDALRDGNGRLLRSWREGRTSGPGFLDDYALVAGALLDLYETTFDETWFTEASRLATEAIRLFADPNGAGFFDTGSDAERLVTRPKDVFDNAVPSGNSVMTEVLLRLAALTGDASLEERAMSFLRSLAPAMAQAPGGFGHLLGALDLALARPKEIAISASVTEAERARRMAQVVWSRYLPNRVLAAGRTEDTGVPLLQDRPMKDGLATAYVCERFVCAAPVTDPESLASQLG